MNQEAIHDRNLAEQVASAISSEFGTRLEAVILFGSAETGSGHDLDLVVVMNGTAKDAPHDAKRLRGVREQFPRHRLDLHLVYGSELGGADRFTLNAQGCYIVPVLAAAKALRGSNPFAKLRPTPTALAEAVLRKGNEYVMRARMTAVGCDSAKKDANPDHWRKNILKMVFDLLLACGIPATTSNVIEVTTTSFPGMLTELELAVLRDRNAPLTPEEALPIMDKILTAMKAIAAETGPLAKPRFHSVDGIACEVLAATRPRGEWIVLCDGLPTVPQKYALMRDLAALGFHVVHPRYRGTWESGGKFLERSPADDIERVMQAIAEGHFGPSAGPVTLLGSSFGGTVALCAAKMTAPQRVVALSPVIGFPAIAADIDSLGAYLVAERSGAYRFASADWQRLRDGNILAPEPGAISHNTKVTIMAGTNDPQVPYQAIADFCKQAGIPLIARDEIGHISFTKARESLWLELCATLDS